MSDLDDATSLPTWERGLKLLTSADIDEYHVSLPTWERGLKHKHQQGCVRQLMSLPTWERGLKQHLFLPILVFMGRSPRGSVD